MDPSKKGWLIDFLAYRKNQFASAKHIDKTKIGQDPEHSFYGIIQPTGIMYGFPVQNLKAPDANTWTEKDKVKVLLIDSLMNIAELYNTSETPDEEAYNVLIKETLSNICKYYESVYPEISISTTNWLGKKKDVVMLAEQLLDKRISNIMSSKNNFWLAFFQRSQLFLDVYIFGQWSHTKPDNILQEFFKGEKEDLSYNAVKVMASAAHANSRIEEEEASLFELFIDSLGMPSEKKRVAKEYFEHGLGIQDIPVESSDPWIIRKFLLELALLTVWSDKKVDQSEIDFITQFNKSLGFTSDDLDKSMIAIEGFVLENWTQLDTLQNKKDFKEVSDEFIKRISAITLTYKNRISNEIKHDPGLLDLIKKGNSSGLTDDEQNIIRTKLVAILNKIPVFSVIALPRSFLNYYNVLKIIPKEVFTAINEEKTG